MRDLSKKQNKQASPVLPVVFSHGTKPFKLAPSLQENDFGKSLPKIPRKIRADMLNYTVRVIDVHHPEVKKLFTDKGSIVGGVLRLFYEIWGLKSPSLKKVKSILKDDFQRLFKEMTPKEADDVILGLGEYLIDKASLNATVWKKALKELKEEKILKGGRKTMTAREVIKQKGILEGEKRGEKRGRKEGRKEVALSLLKQKIGISVISKATGLSKEEIGKLKNGKTKK